MMMNISLDTAINTSTPDFRIWQHFNGNWITTYLLKLTNVPEVKLHSSTNIWSTLGIQVLSFTIKDDDKDTLG